MQEALLYANSNQMQRRDASAVIAKHLPEMSWKEEMEKIKAVPSEDAECERILDIGSGSGDVTMSILSQAIPVEHKLTGLDVSKEMVDFANNRYADNNNKFFCLDIAQMECPRQMFPDGFTKIFSFYCLHWVRNLESAVANMAELLVPGGEGLLVFLANNPIFETYRFLAKTSTWGDYMQDVEKFVPVYQDTKNPAKEFARLLSSNCLKILTCEEVYQSYLFSNKNQVLAAMKAVNPFIQRIPESKKMDYVKHCLNLLTTLSHITSDGQIEARYKLIVTRFKKP